MCGFTGFTNHIDNSNAVLQEMLNRIKHRGPDAEGTYIDEDIALGHRRLSIIDVSDAGTQPLYSADGNLALLFNGEIYNYKTIRQALIEKGYQFATQTDSGSFNLRLSGIRHSTAAKAAWHVLLCHLEQERENFVRGKRFLRHQAAVLCTDGRNIPVRLGNQEFPAASAL